MTACRTRRRAKSRRRSRACSRGTRIIPARSTCGSTLWEPTDTPERAEAEADRLLPLMPGAGHIVHMPAHIYQRVGRHADVVKANLLAAKADEDYIAQCRAQGLYPLVYYPHNLHFIWMGATASGQARARAGLGAQGGRQHPARSARSTCPDSPGLPRCSVLGDGSLWPVGRRFSRNRRRTHDTPFTQGVWRYARAMALVATGSACRGGAGTRATEGHRDRSVDQRSRSRSLPTAGLPSCESPLKSSPAKWPRNARTGTPPRDTSSARSATRTRSIYQEPADWHAPVRQALGAVLLEAGRPDEAEAVFWEDLKKNPEIGLVALRSRAGASGAGQEQRCGAGGRALPQGVGACRRDADKRTDHEVGCRAACDRAQDQFRSDRWPVGGHRAHVAAETPGGATPPARARGRDLGRSRGRNGSPAGRPGGDGGCRQLCHQAPRSVAHGVECRAWRTAVHGAHRAGRHRGLLCAPDAHVECHRCPAARLSWHAWPPNMASSSISTASPRSAAGSI